MQYIPTSHIKNDTSVVISKLQLPDDIIKYILSFHDDYLTIDNNVDNFWIKLGLETCNMRRWSGMVHSILCQSFGFTKVKYACLYKEFSILCGSLDDLVFMNYPQNIHTIQNENYTKDVDQIFYNNSNIVEYPKKRMLGKTKYKKNITQQDIVYINSFINRAYTYIDYLTSNINNLPIDLSIYNKPKTVIRDNKKRILQAITKLRKKCEKIKINTDTYEVCDDILTS